MGFKKTIINKCGLSMMLVFLLIMPFTLTVHAYRGLSLALVYPDPVSGALGYYSYNHEYIYAFKEEPDIRILFGTSNTFDFTSSYPARDVFLADSALLDPTNTDLALNNFTPVSINDPSLSGYANEVSRAKEHFNAQGIDEDQIGVIIIPQTTAASLQDQELYFTYIRHFGNNSSNGFDDFIYFRNYGEIALNETKTSNSKSFQLIEPVIGLEVTKTILTQNNSKAEALDVNVGDTVSFSVVIKNTSDIWLENVMLDDLLFRSNVSNIRIDGSPAFLNADHTLILGNMEGDFRINKTGGHNGKEIVVSYDYVVSEKDITNDNGISSIINTATASGTTPTKSYNKSAAPGTYPYTGADLDVVKRPVARDAATLTLTNYVTSTEEQTTEEQTTEEQTTEEQTDTIYPTDTSTPPDTTTPETPTEQTTTSGINYYGLILLILLTLISLGTIATLVIIRRNNSGKNQNDDDENDDDDDDEEKGQYGQSIPIDPPSESGESANNPPDDR